VLSRFVDVFSDDTEEFTDREMKTAALIDILLHKFALETNAQALCNLRIMHFKFSEVVDFDHCCIVFFHF